MMQLRGSWVLALALSGVGCIGKITDPGSGATSPAAGGKASGGAGGSGAKGGSAGTSGTSGNSGTSSGSGGVGTGGSGTGGGAVVDCDDGTHGAVAPIRRLTLDEYVNALSDVLGVTASEKYPGGSGDSTTGYSTEPGLTIVSEQGVSAIMNAAEEAAQALAPQLDAVLPCAADADEACANTFLDTIGRRAFRRALTAEERATLLGLYTDERADTATFSEAIAVMTAGLLQMPAFLYVLEADVATGIDRARTGPELATRLALQIWGSVPDDALLTAAENDELATKDQVRAQAVRMLLDPRADRALARFFREWSETPVTAVASKDRGAFPYLNDEFVDAVNESFDRFVTDQVRSGAGLHGLLRSNKVFVNGPLADFFGLDPVSDWTSVSLPEDRYTGITTQPALLAAHAHTVSPSYVFRGRFIMKRMLCTDLGKPPANAQAAFGAIEKPVDPTAKETAAVVQARPDCGGCHRVIDPSGLAYEHFDGMGQYRDEYESGKAIDPSGTVLGDSEIEFESPAELMEQLAALPQTEQCFATQLFRFSAAQLGGSEDGCSIQKITEAIHGPDGTLENAFIETTQTDGFLYRRGE